MRVMTYNLWNYHASWEARREAIAEFIVRYGPDVVALQEARHDFRYEGGEGQGEQLARLTGYRATTLTAQVYVPLLRVDEGLTILSRVAPTQEFSLRLRRLPDEREDENWRVCLGVQVQVGEESWDIYDTHFSLSPAARASNAREVTAFVAATSGDRPAVLMGDLNAEPGEEALRVLREEGGFVDAWTAVHGGTSGYTYAAWDGVRRIDYVLVRNVPRVLSAELIGRDAVGGVFPSDHAGLVVEMEGAEAGSAGLVS